MTSSEEARVRECARQLAGIFYRNTPSDKCQTFEDIEQVVREHLLESIEPDLALFLSNKKLKPTLAKSEQSKFGWEITITPSTTREVRSRS